MSYTIVGYVAVAKLEDGSKIALLDYAAHTEMLVVQKVIKRAQLDGFTGTGVQRMLELGWSTEPIYLEDGGRERRAQRRG